MVRSQTGRETVCKMYLSNGKEKRDFTDEGSEDWMFLDYVHSV